MNPKIYQMFPVEIAEYQHQVDSSYAIELLEKERYKEHEAFSSMGNLHENTAYDPIFDLIGKSLEDYRIRFKYDCDNIEVSSSWGNHSLPQSGQNHQFHRHSMSMISGVMYFTNGADIGFEDPMTPRVMNQLEVLRFDYQPFEFIHPAPGKLILFPSWLYHWTKPHMDDFDRWNISFNAFPTGKINYNMATDSTINITLNKNKKAQ